MNYIGETGYTLWEKIEFAPIAFTSTLIYLKGLEEYYLFDMGCWPNCYIQDQSLLAVLDQPDKGTAFIMINWLYV